MTNTIESNKYCTGCSACYYVCPKQAINMGRDEKGFLKPVLQEERCIQCGLCRKVCHLVGRDIDFKKPLLILAAKNKSDQERISSSSGGVFPLLARLALDEGGVVYGAAMDTTRTVRHIRAEILDKALQCCQSKYVQSDAVEAFGQAIEDARAGRKILFTGTSCQIAGLRTYLKSNNISENNVLFVDFICHGTPSPLVFRDFLTMLEEKYGGTIEHFYFRNKDQGWKGNGYKAIFCDRPPVVNGFYLRGFNKLFPLTTNEACFHCGYSQPERISDITLGDFWGIEHTPLADFQDLLGISIIFINTDKGKAWFSRVSEQMKLREAELHDCRYNTPLFHSPEESGGVKDFWDMYLNQGYAPAFNRYCGFIGKKGLYERFKWLVMYKMNMKDSILSVNARIKGHQ